ncbi:MAG: response regulator [Chloroflexota bacterium]
MSYNVLVIEDTPDWRSKIVGYLVETGEYNLKEADDYQTAIELLDNDPFDVAIVDIRLVDWDETNEQGMKLLNKLDEIAEINGTQSIVLTGYATKERMREAFRDHQVVDFIEKQRFSPQEFKDTVLSAAKKAFDRRGEIIENKYQK